MGCRKSRGWVGAGSEYHLKFATVSARKLHKSFAKERMDWVGLVGVSAWRLHGVAHFFCSIHRFNVDFEYTNVRVCVCVFTPSPCLTLRAVRQSVQPNAMS